MLKRTRDTLAGAFPRDHREEVLGLARNIEERERREHPLKRIMGVVEEEEDRELTHWAGRIPVRLAFGAPEPDEALAGGIPVPEYARDYRRPGT